MSPVLTPTMTKAVRRTKIVALKPTIRPSVLNASRATAEHLVRKMVATKNRKMTHLLPTLAIQKCLTKIAAKIQRTSPPRAQLEAMIPQEEQAARKSPTTTLEIRKLMIRKIQRTRKGLQNRISRPKTHRKRLLTARQRIQKNLAENRKTSPANNRAPKSPAKIRSRQGLKINLTINRQTNPVPISP